MKTSHGKGRLFFCPCVAFFRHMMRPEGGRLELFTRRTVFSRPTFRDGLRRQAGRSLLHFFMKNGMRALCGLSGAPEEHR